MSNFSALRTVLQVGETLVGGLEAIEKLTHLGGDRADAALAGIRGVLHSLREGIESKASPQEILAEIESLHAAVAENHADALAELKKRFPPNGGQ